MYAYKTITQTDKLRSIIELPDNIISKQVEIIVLDMNPLEVNNKEIKKFAGALKEFGNPLLIEHETEIALEKAMKEKYDLR
jgi:hypothetical protein